MISRVNESEVSGPVAVMATASSLSAADLALLRNGFTIRHDHRQILGGTTRLFLDSNDSSYVDVPTSDIQGFEKDFSLPLMRDASTAKLQAATDLTQVVNSASATYRLDPDLVNSIIHAESGFNSHAISRKGARGLMQLMPGTAGRLGVANPFDPEANVNGGTRYLRELLERYNFDLVKALAAYNAGPQRVEQFGGVPPYYETRAYVARIVKDFNKKKIAQGKGTATPKNNVAQKKGGTTPTTTAKKDSKSGGGGTTVASAQGK